MRTKTLNEHSNKSLPGESGSVRCTPLPDPGTVNSDPGGAYFMTYQEQLKSPKWQKKRLEILQRDQFKCRNCGTVDEQLHVHHLFYDSSNKIWEYENDYLVTLCKSCHDEWHDTDYKNTVTLFYIAKLLFPDDGPVQKIKKLNKFMVSFFETLCSIKNDN